MGWSYTESVPTRVGANVTDDHCKYLQPTRWKHTSTSARNHDTLQSLAVPRSPALQSWHKRQQLLLDSLWLKGIEPMLAILAWPYQITHSRVSIDRARDLRSQASAQRRGRWNSLKPYVRYRDFSRIPRAPPKFSQVALGARQRAAGSGVLAPRKGPLVVGHDAPHLLWHRTEAEY